MPANVPCLIQLTIVANFIKIEKFTNGILIKTRWVPSSNMFLPCMDTECIGNSYYTKIQTIGDDGKPHTIITLPLNCSYVFIVDGNESDPTTYENIIDLCVAIDGLRCTPCTIVSPIVECDVNINKFVYVPEGENAVSVSISTDGTTSDGYLTLSIDGDVFGPMPNPNADLPPIDFLQTLRTESEDNIIISRSEEDDGQACDTLTVPSLVAEYEIGTSGSDVFITIGSIVALPETIGTIGFGEIFNSTNLTIGLGTVGGVLTVTPDTVDAEPNNYYYCYVLDTVDGVDTVIATVCIQFVNPTIYNAFRFLKNQSPGIAGLETILGITMTNPVEDGDIIYFDNIDYVIPANAFDTNSNIYSVTSSANNVGQAAFADAVNLVSITLLRPVVIETGAFSDAIVLSTVNAEPTTKVHDNAFKNCTALTNIVFGTALTELGTTLGNNSVFQNITGNTINLTYPTALIADTDYTDLIANNTVTVTLV